jgi:hypothetical protein
MPNHHIKPRRPGSLKAAVTALIDAAGGLHGSREVTGRSAARLFGYGDDSDENLDRHMPVNLVLRLEAVAGAPIVTQYLAHEAGYALLPCDASEGCTPSRVISAAKESAEVFAAAAQALADGRLCAAEAEALIPAVDEAIVAFASLRAALRVKAGG